MHAGNSPILLFLEGGAATRMQTKGLWWGITSHNLAILWLPVSNHFFLNWIAPLWNLVPIIIIIIIYEYYQDCLCCMMFNINNSIVTML